MAEITFGARFEGIDHPVVKRGAELNKEFVCVPFHSCGPDFARFNVLMIDLGTAPAPYLTSWTLFPPFKLSPAPCRDAQRNSTTAW